MYYFFTIVFSKKYNRNDIIKHSNACRAADVYSPSIFLDFTCKPIIFQLVTTRIIYFQPFEWHAICLCANKFFLSVLSEKATLILAVKMKTKSHQLTVI